MALGGTKASRIKICAVLMFVSTLVMLFPYVLAYLLGSAKFQYITLPVWVGLFFLASSFVVMVSQLTPIEAKGSGTAKLLGIEMPIEIRGVTVYLLIVYLVLAVFYSATDLEKQFSAEALLEEIEELKEDKTTLQQVVENYRAIHEGNHVEDLLMLKLSFRCDTTNEAFEVTEWNRYSESRKPSTFKTEKSVDRAFPVGREEWVYRIEDGNEDYNNSPIRIRAKLDNNGILSAKLIIVSPEDFNRAYYYCKNGEPYLTGDVNSVSKANSHGN